MIAFSKTIRFRNTKRDQVALNALNHFADYGYQSANDMMVSALYNLAEKPSTPSMTSISPEEFADMVAKRIGGNLTVVAEAVEASPSSNVSSVPTTWDTPDPASDAQMGDILADILSM